MILRYKYPVSKSYDDDTGEPVYVMREGEIEPLRLEREPYEVVLEANGYSFHLLFGPQRSGNFLCIPDWQIGCELSHLDDVFWNKESIRRSANDIGDEEAAAIAHAIKELDEVIRCQK